LVQTKIANKELVSERHAEIVAVCTELFLHKGFHETSVREIANELGWQMGSLYLHISRKEDILHLISQAIMRELWEGLRNLNPEGTCGERLQAAADYFFTAVDRMRPKIKLLYRESASLLPGHVAALKESELQEREYFSRIIQEGIDAGEFRPVDAGLFAHDIIMLAHMWALKGWALWPTMSAEEYRERQLSLLFSHLLINPDSSL
jgi:AcrR family transcriptional regulator